MNTATKVHFQRMTRMQGVGRLLCQGQIVNILDFGGHVISAVATHLGH